MNPRASRRTTMSCHTRVDEWTTIIRTYLPTLSKPQATVLALWSLGMVLARSCALTAVSVWLAAMLQRKENTVRQQLREWCYEATAKRGDQRQALVVEDCFVPLLRWVLHRWQGTQLALALDATTLGTRFTVLAISVVYRGCAIPVAWTILPANQPAACGATGCGCSANCGQPSRGGGPSSCWPIAAYMPPGCFGASCAWVGTPSCASTPGAPSGRTPGRPTAPWPALCPTRARAGAAPAPRSRARSGDCGALCSPPGRKATPIPG